jgi:hypothetical protein
MSIVGFSSSFSTVSTMPPRTTRAAARAAAAEQVLSSTPDLQESQSSIDNHEVPNTALPITTEETEALEISIDAAAPKKTRGRKKGSKNKKGKKAKATTEPQEGLETDGAQFGEDEKDTADDNLEVAGHDEGELPRKVDKGTRIESSIPVNSKDHSTTMSKQYV